MILRCEQTDCEYETDNKRSLKYHLWKKHNIGKGEVCDQPNCKFRANNASQLKTHKWKTHNIGDGEVLKCSQLDCEYQTRCKGHLERHSWILHNIGEGEICSEKDCDFRTKSKVALAQHNWEVHKIGQGEVFICSQHDCNYKTKNKGSLKIHIWRVHDIGKGKVFKCNQTDCEYQTKSVSDLNRHKWHLHGLGDGKIYVCDIDDCKYQTRNKWTMKNHLCSIHDIGDKVCECCTSNVFSLSCYKDPKTNIEANICRKCYNKATGYTSRVEKQMVEYLKSIPEIAPFIVLEDKILKGNACKTRRRPDLLISSTIGMHIIIECDENQHQGYIPKCENGRIDEMLDELSSGNVVIIRWNPDNYKPTFYRMKKTRQQRLELLKNLILHVTSKTDWKKDESIMVFYLFYNNDNEILTNRWKKKMIHDEKDF